MAPVRTLSQMVDFVKGKAKTRRVAVAYGQDPDTIGAVARAVQEKIAEVVLVGDKEKIEKLCKDRGIDVGLFTIEDVKDEFASGKRAVELVRSGEADILMKGLISTTYYMKAVLDKEKGLLPPGKVLSHATVIEAPEYHKLLIVSDVAVIVLPTLEQKIQMLKYCVEIAHKLGIEKPKAGIITANEKVSPKMPSTLDAAVIAKMAERKQIKGVIVDGPLALDVALSKRCAEIKGLESPVAGDVDIMILPSIETGNVFYKSTTLLGKAKLAGIVTGAMAPVVLTSRADTDESKFLSIVFAAAMVEV